MSEDPHRMPNKLNTAQDGATRRPPRRKCPRRASSTSHLGHYSRTKRSREGVLPSETCDGEAVDGRAYLTSVHNLCAVAKFVLVKKPEIISAVEIFAEKSPGLLRVLKNQPLGQVIPQDNIPLFTEWENDEQIQNVGDHGSETDDAQIDREPPESTAHNLEQTLGEDDLLPAGPNNVTQQPKARMSLPAQEQMASEQPLQETETKEDQRGLPEPLDGAAQLETPSAWMSYAQCPSYGHPPLPILDQIPMNATNLMQYCSNAQIPPIPFSLPNGCASEYGFPPTIIPTGPPHAFQHQGLSVPQLGSQFYQYTGHPQFITAPGRNMQQGTEGSSAQRQSAYTGLSLPSDLNVPEPPPAASQTPVGTNLNPPWSAQAGDITLPTSHEPDYLSILNELPSALC